MKQRFEKNKARNGGYILIYLLLALTLLSLVSTVAGGAALRNLRSSELSVKRAKDLYAAEGEIEASIAEAENIDVTGAEGDTKAAAIAAAKGAFEGEMERIFPDSSDSSVSSALVVALKKGWAKEPAGSEISAEGTYHYIVTAKAPKEVPDGGVKVTATIRFTVQFTYDEATDKAAAICQGSSFDEYKTE